MPGEVDPWPLEYVQTTPRSNDRAGRGRAARAAERPEPRAARVRGDGRCGRGGGRRGNEAGAITEAAARYVTLSQANQERRRTV